MKTLCRLILRLKYKDFSKSIHRSFSVNVEANAYYRTHTYLIRMVKLEGNTLEILNLA